MPGILTDEEALLAALDEDSANYTILAALADLKREQGEDNVADWLEWASRMKRKPSTTGFGWHSGNTGKSILARPDTAMVPSWFGACSSALPPTNWFWFVKTARDAPFKDPGWPPPEG